MRRQHRHPSPRQRADPRARPLRPHRPPPHRCAGSPGALAAITACFHEGGVNIIETNHQRIFSKLPAKDTVIEVECEARDAEAMRPW
jgi:hypothetical protein